MSDATDMAGQPDGEDEGSWFAVRCVLHHGRNKPGGPQDLATGEHAYEERVTLWFASSADEAIELAEKEAEQYAASTGSDYSGLAQSYWLDDEPGDGVVVFSLSRKSQLATDAYVDAFFDTGTEYEENVEG